MASHIDFLTGKWITDKPKKKSPEASVGRAVDDFLRLKKIYSRTIKSDGTKTAKGWRKSAQGTGISDRIGIMPDGRFLAIELKATGKKSTLTEAQFSFLSKILESNGIALVADSVEDLSRALLQSKEEMRETLNKWMPRKEYCRPSTEPLFP